jgi:NAD(P)-dependent dehydrogenase (short-subunit alcohol dehydrogenase family)
MSQEITYLVTGATGGLGSEVTRALLERGAAVVALDRHEPTEAFKESLGQAAERFSFHQTDVTDPDQVQLALEAYQHNNLGGVAHLVGGYMGASIAETDLEGWEKMVTLNLKSSFLVLRAAARVLPQVEGSPGVVCVGSMLARSGAAGHAAYASTKAGVLALVRSAAADLSGSRVRVNAVLPSTIATPANLEAMPEADHDQWVTPAQVAATIAFLLSPQASGVTGACVEVAGAGYQP